jgi:hypothetical protein
MKSELKNTILHVLYQNKQGYVPLEELVEKCCASKHYISNMLSKLKLYGYVDNRTDPDFDDTPTGIWWLTDNGVDYIEKQLSKKHVKQDQDDYPTSETFKEVMKKHGMNPGNFLDIVYFLFVVIWLVCCTL